MPTNDWQIGGLYRRGTFNGVPGYFSQPGGIGQPVFPTQQNAQPWPDYPIPGLFIQEYLPWWSPGCGHSIKEWMVIREFDYDSNQSVALICCCICTFVQNVYSPFE